MPFKSDKGRNLGKHLNVYDTSVVGENISPAASQNVASTFDASGGNVYLTPSRKIHVFNASGSFNINSLATNPESNFDILLAGGGGGGAGAFGSGGGGGGVVYQTGINMSVLGQSAIPIVVGTGGGGLDDADATKQAGELGGSSSFGASTDSYHLVALGGGGGREYSSSDGYDWSTNHPPSAITQPPGNEPRAGMSGGCGGGGGTGAAPNAVGGTGRQTTYDPLPANSKTHGNGTDGGDNTSYETGNNYSRTGGGGAGGAGGGNACPNATPAGAHPGPGLQHWGWGGDGLQVPDAFLPNNSVPATVITALGGVPSTSPEWRYFGGGGAGGSNGGPATSGIDGNGKNRGGLGNNTGPTSSYEYGFGSHTGAGGNGCPGRGGGGGGGKWSTFDGGSGGGGCVIISYPLTS